MKEHNEQYQELYPTLEGIADELRVFLGELIGTELGVAHISCRAKTPTSFRTKAEKTSECGTNKYAAPLVEIQDQIGARVIVRYLGEIDKVAERLERYLTPWESQNLEPENPKEFGYISKHWVFSLPTEAMPQGMSRDKLPRCFELQLKTLLQHAWAEAEHGLGYKAMQELSREDQRRLARAAALAEEADELINEVRGSS